MHLLIKNDFFQSGTRYEDRTMQRGGGATSAASHRVSFSCPEHFTKRKGHSRITKFAPM